MKKEMEQLYIEFNDRASEIFFPLFSKFEEAVKDLDRRRDDNVFQQMAAKYVYTLKQQLENIAKSMIEKNQSLPEFHQLQRELTNRINDFIQEFVQKSHFM